MNANPLHNNYRIYAACGYTTFVQVEYCKHVAEHIEHIAEVREVGRFPIPKTNGQVHSKMGVLFCETKSNRKYFYINN